MGNLKKQEQKIKITGKDSPTPKCSSDQYPSFSFRYLTTNRRYNFSAVPPDGDHDSTYDALFLRLVEISSESWTYWGQLRKEMGYETIPYGQIRFQASGLPFISNDSKIIVFRFNGGSMRILGYKKAPCATLQIIGFDFDYSAYDHG